MLNHLGPLRELHESKESVGEPSAASKSTILDRIAHHLNNDEDLIGLLRAGKVDALTVLFHRHSTLVFRIARRILRDDGEAEDVVQQMFLDLFRSAAKFDPSKGTFKVWLLMYAYHRAINHRRNPRAARYYDTEDLEEVLREYALTDRGRPFPFQTAEAAHLVRETLEQIQPRQRKVIELVYYEGCTADEIAEQTGDSAHVVALIATFVVGRNSQIFTDHLYPYHSEEAIRSSISATGHSHTSGNANSTELNSKEEVKRLQAKLHATTVDLNTTNAEKQKLIQAIVDLTTHTCWRRSIPCLSLPNRTKT